MAYKFASDEWIDDVWAQLRGDEAIRLAGATWAHGPLLLVVRPHPDSNFNETLALRLDLHEGEARDLRRADLDDGQTTPFVIAGTYPRWRKALAGDIDLLDALLEAKLSFKGDLPTLERHRSLIAAVLQAAARVETSYPEDAAAAPAAASR